MGTKQIKYCDICHATKPEPEGGWETVTTFPNKEVIRVFADGSFRKFDYISLDLCDHCRDIALRGVAIEVHGNDLYKINFVHSQKEGDC
jgi:hypothetical protein